MKLRMLIAEYGYVCVHASFEESKREDLEFLSAPCAPAASATSAAAPASDPQPQQETKVVQQKPVKKANKKQMQKEDTISSLTQPKYHIVREDLLPLANLTDEKEESEESEVESEVKEAKEAKREKAAKEAKEAKRLQKQLEEKKHQELVDQGIEPESLLTKANMEKWVAEKKPYSIIAREIVGLPEHRVSRA